MLRRVKQYIAPYLFPLFCILCEKEGSVVCDMCIKSIPAGGVFCCPICHAVTLYGVCCDSCKDVSFLSQHIAIDRYKEGDLFTEMIHLLKYEYVEEVLLPLASLIQDFVHTYSNLFVSIDSIIPVPLHPKRYAERGYNQAELTAQLLGKHIGKPVVSLLKRKKSTNQQALLSREDRMTNVKDAFIIDKYSTCKNILLVDDVYTTGATMQECATVLQSKACMKVIGFSLARG